MGSSYVEFLHRITEGGQVMSSCIGDVQAPVFGAVLRKRNERNASTRQTAPWIGTEHTTYVTVDIGPRNGLIGP